MAEEVSSQEPSITVAADAANEIAKSPEVAAVAGEEATGHAGVEGGGSLPHRTSGLSKLGSQGDAESPDIDEEYNPASDMRNMRRIIADDPEWTLTTVPLLSDSTLKHIINNFEFNSDILHKLQPKDKAFVLARISTQVPVRVTANLVQDEGYWKRCCQDRWQVCKVSDYNGSWKRMYFERHLQNIIELFVPNASDRSELDQFLPLSAQYVRRLLIRQLLPPVMNEPKAPDGNESDAGDDDDDDDAADASDHFDITPVVHALPHLEELDLTYGVRDCGMNFEWKVFEFTAKDCAQLSECLQSCKTLRAFRLCRSRVSDDKIRVIIKHLLDHPCLEELDLSHNLISDRGARAVGKLLSGHSRLVKLNLCNNDIRQLGSQAIAHALTKNDTLTHLNLRMNRLGDDGGQALCRALLKNSTVSHLHLGSNNFSEPTAAAFAQVVVQNESLRVVDLTCNKLGPDGGKQLESGMKENSTITELDLRLTDCGQESEYCISQVLHENRENARVRREPPRSSGVAE